MGKYILLGTNQLPNRYRPQLIQIQMATSTSIVTNRGVPGSEYWI